MRVLSWAYLALTYAFEFLPVVVLVVFSFQDGRLPVPPFHGFSLQWYDKIFADAGLIMALWNSALEAFLSSALALLMEFLAAHALICGRDRAGIGPARRPMMMVFQDYAPFPHMSIAANVWLGLRMQGVARAPGGYAKA
jgi:ABC-type spermidine/putrescine transport system permease subunit II